MKPAAAGPARVSVRVTPRAARNGLAGWSPEGELLVRITAPPVEGEANAELVRFLARLLHRPKSSLRVVRGASGRHKQIEVDGMSGDELRRLLDAADR